MNKIKNFLKDESGLELTEYAVASGVIVAGLIVLFTQLGSAIKTKISTLVAQVVAGS